LSLCRCVCYLARGLKKKIRRKPPRWPRFRERGNTTNLLEKKKKKKRSSGMTSSEVFKFIYALLRFFLKKKELMWVRTYINIIYFYSTHNIMGPLKLGRPSPALTNTMCVKQWRYIRTHKSLTNYFIETNVKKSQVLYTEVGELDCAFTLSIIRREAKTTRRKTRGGRAD
jgi:hypothetical protein